MLAMRRRRRIIAFAWLAAVGLGSGAAAVSVAAFTDQRPIEVAFSTGTIAVGVDPATALITFAGMVPNDQVEGALTVVNAGSGALRYAMTVDATDGDGKHLRDVLQLDAERRDGCGGPLLETLYSGPVGAAAFGNPEPGADPGDRLLAVGASEVICFRATLPWDTDVLYQGAATGVTLTFWAEQVSGNP
ncbi:MAG: hypothetical protein ACHQZR_05120 [Candidatus Limnocylindrales bacterium]